MIQEIAKKREDALLKNWKEITHYVKINFNGLLPDNEEVFVSSEKEKSICLGVTPIGDSYLISKDSSNGSNLCKMLLFGDEGRHMDSVDKEDALNAVESLVLSWKKVKSSLENIKERESAIYDFEI